MTKLELGDGRNNYSLVKRKSQEATRWDPECAKPPRRAAFCVARGPWLPCLAAALRTGIGTERPACRRAFLDKAWGVTDRPNIARGPRNRC
jgi:hypothetical protein